MGSEMCIRDRAKSLGYGAEYRYAHDEPHGFSPGQRYFPSGLDAERYYEPTDRGLEQKIKEKLAYLRNLNDQAD